MEKGAYYDTILERFVIAGYRKFGRKVWEIDILSWLTEAAKSGFHGSYLLVFTCLIWLIFLLILYFNVHSRLNTWCFISGMLFSLGTLKEYLYYELGPVLILQDVWTISGSETLYSLLSAVLYYYAMPSMLIFALYFSHAELSFPHIFRGWHFLCYLPAMLMALLFPYGHTLQYQSEMIFCLSVACYNLGYGILITVLLLRTLWQERLTEYYHQRQLAAVSVLVPIWFWMILAFPYHAIGIDSMVKAWQLNLGLLIFLLMFLLYHAFRGGIWGTRYRREHYSRSTEEIVLQSNTNYISHALKNDISKINWCLELLEQQGIRAKELDIIRNSTNHLESFLQQTQCYSNKIMLDCLPCDVQLLFTQLCEDFVVPVNKKIQVEISACDQRKLYCDQTHVKEVLQNLMNNAMEAIEKEGQIRLSYKYMESKKKAMIQIVDTGCGIEDCNIRNLSKPFYTTKKNNWNMGLGLYYCYSVMEAHGGRIEVKSELGKGSAFSLYFPVKGNEKQRRKRLWKRFVC